MIHKNQEGYPDPTAGNAIRGADKVPENIAWFIKTVKDLAGLVDLEITGRIQVRDKKTKKEYR